MKESEVRNIVYEEVRKARNDFAADAGNLRKTVALLSRDLAQLQTTVHRIDRKVFPICECCGQEIKSAIPVPQNSQYTMKTPGPVR